MSVLLEKGAKIDITDSCGATAALKAAYAGQKLV